MRGRPFFFARALFRPMRSLIALSTLILAACGSVDEVERPSQADNERLDEIEAMLDEEAGDGDDQAVTASD